MSFNESLLNRFPKLQTIQVYALGSKRWKTIECPDPYMFPSRQFNKMLPGLLFNGALHWSPGMTTNQGTNSEVIVCFDINSEKLMDVPLPEEPRLHLRSRNSYKQVGLLGDCLCVVFLYSFQADIWVMKDYGVSESWTKVLTISQLTMFTDPFLKPLWAFENGDVLVHSCEELSLCSQNNGIIKVLLHGNHPESYVESLVSLKSDTYVKRSTTNGIRRNPSDRD
ncbi:F-box/kelch-repeat protein At3g06240-like [Papaver somniferum]|uniref:F-box/kelch-repeat protein At3g06240-like n=1 Tax=Papaver somniferum TaxID=3469 RepID=UPI000E6F6D7C|nr:F-box/kelch-repeat protein At3g06240-like [Papaver somniferum]